MNFSKEIKPQMNFKKEIKPQIRSNLSMEFYIIVRINQHLNENPIFIQEQEEQS